MKQVTVYFKVPAFHLSSKIKGHEETCEDIPCMKFQIILHYSRWSYTYQRAYRGKAKLWGLGAPNSDITVAHIFRAFKTQRVCVVTVDLNEGPLFVDYGTSPVFKTYGDAIL